MPLICILLGSQDSDVFVMQLIKALVLMYIILQKSIREGSRDDMYGNNSLRSVVMQRVLEEVSCKQHPASSVMVMVMV